MRHPDIEHAVRILRARGGVVDVARDIYAHGYSAAHVAALGDALRALRTSECGDCNGVGKIWAAGDAIDCATCRPTGDKT